MSDGSETETTYLNVSQDIKHAPFTERDFLSMMIELYRERPVLWKVKHPMYGDKGVRAMAVKEIVRELKQFKPDFDEDMYKRKVNTLRTTFNKQRNRIKRAKEAGYECKPRLWYFNELLFLLEQDIDSESQGNNSTSNIADDSTATNDAITEVEVEEEVTEPEEKYLPEPRPEPRPRRVPRVVSKELVNKPAHRSFRNITIKRRRVEEADKDEGDPEDDKTEVVTEGYEEDPQQYMQITTTYYKKPKTSEDLLAELWAKKLKKLSPSQKVFAEKIIHDVLYQGELGNLTKNGVSFCPAF